MLRQAKIPPRSSTMHDTQKNGSVKARIDGDSISKFRTEWYTCIYIFAHEQILASDGIRNSLPSAPGAGNSPYTYYPYI